MQTTFLKSHSTPRSSFLASRTLRSAVIVVAVTSSLTAFAGTRHRWSSQTTTTATTAPATTTTAPTTTTTAPTTATTTAPASTTTASTSANNYYVATTGSDSNAGTQSAPFRTIMKASTVTKPDTTVHVAPGTYAETITTTANGTASGRIRYVSDTKWGAKIVPVANGDTMWKADGGYTDIDGFQINGTGSTSVRQGIYLTGGNSTVKNSWVHHVAENSGCDGGGGAALLADQGRGQAFNNYDFTGNLVHNIGGGCGFIQGIYHASSGTIKNNVVYASVQAINMGHDAHNIDAVNNTLFGNSGYGVWFGGCTEAYTSNNCPMSGINIQNNIIYDNYGGIQGPNASEDTGGNNTIQNNVVVSNGISFDLASHSLGQVSGTINADPQFVNYIRSGGGDYHLRSSSSAIDKGISTRAPSTDINGTARPLGAGIDIGAYENY